MTNLTLKLIAISLALFASLHAQADTLKHDTGEIWVAGWQDTAPLNTQRAGAAIIKVGDVIYAIGGIDGVDFLRTVEYSLIQDDGALSPWRLTAPLNERRGFFDAVVHHGYIYAVGGANGPGGKNLLRTVERARIQVDGSLGPWQQDRSQLTYPRRCVKLALAGDTIYALGGFSGTLLDSVERARIRTDGTLEPWSLEDKPMTMPRYVNTVKKIKNALYVIGGHNQSEGSGRIEVEYATINANNKLTPWKGTTAMAFGRYALSSAAYRDYLYAMGGLQGAIYSDVIETSRTNARDGLGIWRTNTTLSSPRANFGAVVHDEFIYVIGGTNRDGYFRSVEYASINEAGEIGFWATPAMAAAFKQQRDSRNSARQTKLPNGGRVTDIIHTSLYSYIEVEDGGTRRWVAAPRSEFAPGDRIRYSRGVTMTNFHSSTLKRDFPVIIFVERVERISGN